ncbi:MAG: MFS transporter [Oscillospiraceae bacterium]|nr:MFS transporter [Oscillospiraceae bacterium]
MTSGKNKVSVSAVAACLICMFSVGMVYLWSVFQKPVTDACRWSASAVTMVSSAVIFMYVLGSLAGGALTDRFGPGKVAAAGGALFCAGLLASSVTVREGMPVWSVYLTYGAVAGTGTGFTYSSALNCIQRWYPHKRGFATGISVCAFGLSATVTAPLITALIDSRGLTSTFRILAFTFPVLVVLASAFVKNPGREYLDGLAAGDGGEKSRQYTPKETLRTLKFWCLALSLLFLPAAYMMIIPRVKTLAVARGLTENTATLTVALTGAASAISRLIAAAASDRAGRAVTIWVLTLITLAASVCMTFARGWLYIAAVLLIVAGYSGPAGIFPAMASDSFGVKYSATNYGMAFMFLGISAPLFTVISNTVSSAGAETGNYTAAFIIAAASCAVPLIMLPVYDLAGKKRVKK